MCQAPVKDVRVVEAESGEDEVVVRDVGHVEQPAGEFRQLRCSRNDESLVDFLPGLFRP